MKSSVLFCFSAKLFHKGLKRSLGARSGLGGGWSSMFHLKHCRWPYYSTALWHPTSCSKKKMNGNLRHVFQHGALNVYLLLPNSSSTSWWSKNISPMFSYQIMLLWMKFIGDVHFDHVSACRCLQQWPIITNPLLFGNG